MEVRTYREEFGGKPLMIEIGRLAGQANGSARIQYGETTILVTAVMSTGTKDVDYMPLSVEFEEKYYAAGKIKGSKWLKREGRPTDDAILTGRVIDRSIRPRFNHRMRNEVQVVATVLSFDKINDADMPALFGASLALMISDIPYRGPVSSVRVGRVDGQFVINPTYAERITSDIDIIVAGTSEKINMLEAGANIVPEKDITDAIAFGFTELKKLNTLQEKIAKEIAPVKRDIVVSDRDEVLATMVNDFVAPKLEQGLYTPSKQEFYKNIHEAHDSVLDYVRTALIDLPAGKAGDPALNKKLADAEHYFEDTIDKIVHKNILESEKRPDGRKLDELRNISAEVNVLPQTHGSGLFQRGQTQALSILTLASPGMEQWMESMEIDLTKKRFMHHYTFPPFSVGETGRIGNPGRREIGHGALAERALIPIIPLKDTFPYTIRVVSEILSSNGSSSMASVCGASLALMDGGVPIKMAAAGIAMGLMFDEKDEKFKILTDIQGPEDHHGDMDMKVAGTKDGVTAMQMDVKVDGITQEILIKTLEQAKKARLEILEHMTKGIATHRPQLSSHAPRIKTIKIDPSKIGLVIGSGGKTINAIIEETKTTIDIEDDGSIFITSDNDENMDKAIARIESLTYEPKPGDEFDGIVTRLMDFGAFVQFAGDIEGMVHVSQISSEHLNKPSDVLQVGDQVHVWVREIDDRGRINLTMKHRK
ncbi:MAG: polyribonucleotide nucleotidyltransferase [Patescibacteria group bacterium]